MKNISFNLSGKIDPLLVDVISLIDQEAAGLGIPFFIVGAMARDIVLMMFVVCLCHYLIIEETVIDYLLSPTILIGLRIFS